MLTRLVVFFGLLILGFFFLDHVIYVIASIQLFLFYILIIIAKKSKNNFLFSIIILNAISNLIGGLFFYYNQDDYSYSGWNAIMNFDFTLDYYCDIYLKYFISLFLFSFFVLQFGKFIKTNEIIVNDESSNNSFLNVTKRLDQFKKYSNTKYNFILFLSLFIVLAISIEMYSSKIAIIGIPNKPLPFKINGVLFYLRGYIFPIIIFWIYLKSNRSFFVNFATLLIGLVVGMLSISKGITFMYIFPVILSLVLSRSYFKTSLAFILLIIAYANTSFARGITFENVDLSAFQFFTNYLSNLSIDQELLSDSFKIIGALSNRLYGPQDLVLADQYILSNTFENFLNFISLKSLIPEIAYEIYGLDFGPDSGFGVGMGLGGILIILFNSNFLIFILTILFFSFLVSCIEFQTNYLFGINKNTKSFNPLYFFIILFLSFNVVEGSLRFLYLFIIFSILGHFGLKIFRKINIKNIFS